MKKEILENFFNVQREFSLKTFGKAPRLHATYNHFSQELDELKESPNDGTEWADCFLIAIDGAMRSGMSIEELQEGVNARTIVEPSKEPKFDFSRADILLIDPAFVKVGFKITDANRWLELVNQIITVYSSVAGRGLVSLMLFAKEKQRINIVVRQWPPVDEENELVMNHIEA